jgi:hypothetical protein
MIQGEALMSVRVMWDNQEKTILHYIYEGTWTWEEWYAAVGEARRMMERVEHKVYVIVDAACQEVPPGALARFRHAASGETEHVRMVILVGDNPFIETLFGIVRNIARGCVAKFTLAASLEDAYQIIQQHQMAESLPPV